MNAWVTWVKNFASRNKMSYGCAMSDPRCKSEYQATKKKSARNPVSFVPKTKTQKPIKKVFKAVESDEEDTESDVSDDEEPKQKLRMPDELSKVIQDFARPKKTPLTEAKMLLKKVRPFIQKFVDEQALELFKKKKEEGVLSMGKAENRDFDTKRISHREELLDEIYDKLRKSRKRQLKADDTGDTKTYKLEQEVINIYKEAEDELNRYLSDDVLRIVLYAVDDLQRAENKEKKKQKAERETMGVEDKLSKQAEKERERERKRLKKLDNERKLKLKAEKEARKSLRGSGFSFWVEN